MIELITLPGIVIYGYLLGSVPASYIVGRFVKGIDLRSVGSGTVGASNVFYNVGRRWIFPVGLFDLFIKGLSPVLLARFLGQDELGQSLGGLAAVIGHNWPLYLGFKGGRGVAPTAGVLLAMARLELAVFIVLGTIGWRLTRSSAVWVLLGFSALPLLTVYWQRPTGVLVLAVGLLVVTITKRLLSNSVRGSGVPVTRLLINRLLYDRDIADHDAWVYRQASGRDLK